MKPDNTIYLVGRIREYANAVILAGLEKDGIRELAPSHGDILTTLMRHRELTMTDISEHIHRDRSTVTTLVAKLKKLGYVESRPNPKDQRSSLISLTEQGEKLMPTVINISQELMDITFQGIEEEERSVFRSVLEKIVKNFMNAN